MARLLPNGSIDPSAGTQLLDGLNSNAQTAVTGAKVGNLAYGLANRVSAPPIANPPLPSNGIPLSATQNIPASVTPTVRSAPGLAAGANGGLTGVTNGAGVGAAAPNGGLTGVVNGAGVGVAEAGGASRLAQGLGTARGLLNGGASTLGRVAAGAGAAVQAGQALADGGAGTLIDAARNLDPSLINDQGSTERYAKRFGVSPLADNPDGGVLEALKFAGLRAGGFASDLAAHTPFIGGKIAGLYRDNQDANGNPITPAAPVPGAASPVLTGANAGIDTRAPAQAQGLAGTPLDGAPGVRRVDGPNGTPLYTNATSNAADQAFLNGRGTVSTGGSAADLASEQRAGDLATQISNMRAGLRDRGNINAYLSSAGRTAGQQPGGVSDETQAQIQRITSGGRNLTAAGAQAVNSLLAQDQQNQRAGAELNERARATDVNAGLTQRGQDITEEGQIRQQQTAQLAAQRAFSQQNRDFGLRAAEFGQRQGEFATKQQNEAFDQRQKATSDLADRYSKQFTTTDAKGNQVVDSARVARYTNGVQNFLGNRQQELQNKVDAGTASADEVAGLKAIQTKGIAALDENDLAHVDSLVKLGERQQQTAGLTGGRFVQSSDPSGYEVVGRKQNLIGSDTLRTRNGGTIRENDTRFVEPGNTILPNIFKQKTTDFDQAKGLRK